MTVLIFSILFYAVNPFLYLLLFFSSICINFMFAKLMINFNKRKSEATRVVTLVCIICINLSSLIYFKFLLLDVNPLTISRNLSDVENIVLPLGISFYTFQQIALQVDCYWKKVKSIDFLEYASFISFFPQLIAGPIVFQREMIPQFSSMTKKNLTHELAFSAILIFSIGLFKKTVFADSIANGVDEVYLELLNNGSVPLFDAWICLFAFPLQVYFDFSAYTDMACGIALLFGIKLTQNFSSPFKARSIIEFWSTWHITLMRFFRDYVFNPLSIHLTRISLKRGYSNHFMFALSLVLPVMIVFFLTGIWHGSGFNFIMYGIVHGVAVSINHFWREFKMPLINKTFSWLLTFLFVSLAFVLMRSDDFYQFNLFLKSLIFGKIYLPNSLSFLNFISSKDYLFLTETNIIFSNKIIQFFNTSSYLSLFVLGLIFVCKFAPNSNELVQESVLKDQLAGSRKYVLSTNTKALVTGLLLGISIIALTFNSNNFIYFQF